MPCPNPALFFPNSMPYQQLRLMLAAIQELSRGKDGAQFANAEAYKWLYKDMLRGHPFFTETIGRMAPATRHLIDCLSMNVFPTPEEIAALPNLTNNGEWGAYVATGIRWNKSSDSYEVCYYDGEAKEMITRIVSHDGAGQTLANDRADGNEPPTIPSHYSTLHPSLLTNGDLLLAKRWTGFATVITAKGHEESLFDSNDFFDRPEPAPRTGFPTPHSVVGFRVIHPSETHPRVHLLYEVQHAPDGTTSPRYNSFLHPSQLQAYSPLIERFHESLSVAMDERLRRFWRVGADGKWIDQARNDLGTAARIAIGEVLEGICLLVTKRAPNPTLIKLKGKLWVNLGVEGNAGVRHCNVREGWFAGQGKDGMPTVTREQERALADEFARWDQGDTRMEMTRDKVGEDPSLWGYRVDPADRLTTYRLSLQSIMPSLRYTAPTPAILAAAISAPSDDLKLPTEQADRDVEFAKVHKFLLKALSKGNEGGWLVQAKEGGVVDLGGVLVDIPAEELGGKGLQFGQRYTVWLEINSILNKSTGLVCRKIAQIKSLKGKYTDNIHDIGEQCFLSHTNTLALQQTNRHSTAHASFNRFIDEVNLAIRKHRALKASNPQLLKPYSWSGEDDERVEKTEDEQELDLSEAMRIGARNRAAKRAKMAGLKREIIGLNTINIPFSPALLVADPSPDLPEPILAIARSIFTSQSRSTLQNNSVISSRYHLALPLSSLLNLSPNLPQALFILRGRVAHPILIYPDPKAANLPEIWKECLVDSRTILKDAIEKVLDVDAMEYVGHVSGSIGVRGYLQVHKNELLDGEIRKGLVGNAEDDAGLLSLGQAVLVEFSRSKPEDKELKEMLRGL